LLEQDVPVLVYAGDKDFICNWLGNEAWSLELEWSGGSEFAGTELEPWTVGGHEAGQVRNYDIFTFLRVYGAGHMVPFNQPKNSLAMLNSWLDGDFSLSA
jgi:cathepsin A (carboxypeptidase C)